MKEEKTVMEYYARLKEPPKCAGKGIDDLFQRIDIKSKKKSQTTRVEHLFPLPDGNYREIAHLFVTIHLP